MIKFAFSLFDQLMCAIPVHEISGGGGGNLSKPCESHSYSSFDFIVNFFNKGIV